MSFLISHVPQAHSFFPKTSILEIPPNLFLTLTKKSEALIKKPFPSLDNVRDFTWILHVTKILGWRGALAYGNHSRGRLSYKVKVPPVRIENSLSPLYRGTDFSTLAETFQTVWGEARWVNELALKPKKAHSLKRVKTIHGFSMIISKLQA